jgi:hypothetical protein
MGTLEHARRSTGLVMVVALKIQKLKTKKGMRPDIAMPFVGVDLTLPLNRSVVVPPTRDLERTTVMAMNIDEPRCLWALWLDRWRWIHKGLTSE